MRKVLWIVLLAAAAIPMCTEETSACGRVSYCGNYGCYTPYYSCYAPPVYYAPYVCNAPPVYYYYPSGCYAPPVYYSAPAAPQTQPKGPAEPRPARPPIE